MKLALNILIFLLISLNIHAYSQQRIKDFYLSNFKEDGSHDWEVRGKEAMVYDKYIDIKTMKARYYLKDDTIFINSDKARLDKESTDIYLENNVHIENKDGATVATDSLNWQRDKNQVSTKDWVKATNNEMQITAQGLSADTQLRKANFQKDVAVSFPDKESKAVITATCSGPLEIEYNAGKAVFHDNVVVTHTQGKVFSDKSTLFFDPQERVIIKIISEGNVKIVRQGSITFAERATYFSKEDKLILEGRPRIIYYPDEEDITESTSQ